MAFATLQCPCEPVTPFLEGGEFALGLRMGAQLRVQKLPGLFTVCDGLLALGTHLVESGFPVVRSSPKLFSCVFRLPTCLLDLGDTLGECAHLSVRFGAAPFQGLARLSEFPLRLQHQGLSLNDCLPALCSEGFGAACTLVGETECHLEFPVRFDERSVGDPQCLKGAFGALLQSPTAA